MSKAKIIVLSVVHQGLSKAEVARKYDVSWQWVHTLVQRYRTEGETAFKARSTRPHSNPNATEAVVRDLIIALRHELSAQGLDAGPVTLAWHLNNRGLKVPSTSTIRRILTDAGLITAEPKKRPKNSLQRFQADQPNECWQSDFTHWILSDGTDVEILNWLDDHSRYLLACTVFKRVTGDHVIDTFAHTLNIFGPPAETLTDNGSVYTSRFTGGKNAFEYLLATLGINQKNGHPGHPQTQGKIERFHQTLKKWLRRQPQADTINGLQHQLDAFRTIYNQQRPHRSLNGKTPEQAYLATIKATPVNNNSDNAHYRIRIDAIDKFGKLTLRRAGRFHHLGVGITHARKRVLIIIKDLNVTVTDQKTAEILGEYQINPEHNYQPNQTRNPGRWPGSKR
jgi:transposase InsO family protein